MTVAKNKLDFTPRTIELKHGGKITNYVPSYCWRRGHEIHSVRSANLSRAIDDLLCVIDFDHPIIQQIIELEKQNIPDIRFRMGESVIDSCPQCMLDDYNDNPPFRCIDCGIVYPAYDNGPCMCGSEKFERMSKL